MKEQRMNTHQILEQLEEQLKSMDQIHELLTEIRFLDGIEEIEAMYFAFMEGRHLFTTLKVHKHENFFGSDFEFLTFLWLVMPNYYFLEFYFFIGPILGKPRLFTGIDSIRGKRFSLQVWWKKFFPKNSKI